MKRVAVIGGGHGQSIVLRGLKKVHGIKLTAIVTVADDGGSTGRLRREFNIPAMGDIRGVMNALAEEENLLTDLMEYRFEDDDGQHGEMDGHNLGNIILTALTKETGSFMEAVTKISKVLRVKGDIVPSTTEVISLYAVMEDGTIVRGESNIPRYRNKITRVYYDHDVKATDTAVKAITEADYIIFGIGSLYTSILPNLIIKDIAKAVRESKGKKIYICNSMTQAGETEGYSVEDHVKAIEDVIGTGIDKVVFANDEIPEELLERYRAAYSEPVRIRKRYHPYEIEKLPLLDFKDRQIHHDAAKIRDYFEKEVNET